MRRSDARPPHLPNSYDPDGSSHLVSLQEITGALHADRPVILAADDDASVREPVKLFCSLVAQDYSSKFGSEIPYLVIDRPEPLLAILELVSPTLLSKVVVVSDHNYGEKSSLSGAALVEKIETMHPGVKKIIFSGDAELPEIQQLQHRGIAKVIGKPDFISLISSLKELVGVTSTVKDTVLPAA